MEVVIGFNTFCNICFNKESLRKIEETEHLRYILTKLIENKIIVQGQEIYLCLNCCEKLEGYDRFKEICLRNFLNFRIEYFGLKEKLEITYDPNVENKLRNFIETKVYGASHTLNSDASEDTLKAECNIIPLQVSEKNLTEKQDEDKDNDLYSVNCKTEKVEYEDIEEYKFHTEINLEYSEEDLEMPVPSEHIKVESCVEEDIGASESSIEQSEYTEPYKTEKADDSTTKLMQDNTSASFKTLNKNGLSTNEEISDIGASESNIELSKSTESYKTEKAYDSTSKLMQDKTKVSSKTLNENGLSTNKKISGMMCNICRKTFSSSSNLSKHMRIHTGVKPFECEVCHERFTQLVTYKVHKLTHTGEKPHTCTVCKKSFRHLSSLRKHEQLHTEVVDAAVDTYSCNVCNNTYTKLRHLKEHEWIHTEEWPHRCNICNKGFSQRNVLKRHMLIHTDENPYTCRICQKSFYHVSHLTRHMRVHTGEKPYECPECNKRFADPRTYRVHKLTHTGERPHSCSVCKKTFRQLGTLRRHERTHTNNRDTSNVECNICKKTFFDASNLSKHMRVHTGEKPYTCTICNKSFTQTNSLKRHVVIHSAK